MDIRSHNPLFRSVLIVLLVMFSQFTQAQDLPVNWRVKSLYTDKITGRTQSPITWEYQTDKNDNGFVVSVRDESGRVEYRAELLFNQEKCLYKINTYTKIAGKEKLLSHSFDPMRPVIFEDALVPSNWLNGPLPWDGKNKIFNIIKKIGSIASFAENYLIKGKVLEIKDAIDLGLISNRTLNLDIISPQLLLLTVERINDNGPDEEVVKQLWSKKIDFWLYEKTPFRESWYVSE